MIKIVVFIDWLIYYYTDTTQRDGSYQILSKEHRLLITFFSSIVWLNRSQWQTSHWVVKLLWYHTELIYYEATSIKHEGCVCVCVSAFLPYLSVMQIAYFLCRITLSSVCLKHIFHKGQNFRGKKLLNIKCVTSFSPQSWYEIFV